MVADKWTAATILMVVGVVNPSPTSILCRYGAGVPRVQGRGSLDPRVRRTATKWLFANVLVARRNEDCNRGLLFNIELLILLSMNRMSD